MFGVKPEDGNVHITGSPLYHTAVLMFASGAMHMGHAVVLMEKWTPESMLQRIDRYKVTTSHMVPTQFHRLLQLPADVRGRYDCSSTRTMVHAAAPCPPDIKRRMIEWWGNSIWEYYAATEGGGTIVSPQEWMKKPGTVGKAWPSAELKIFDDEGNEQPTGTPGTVYMLRGQADFEYYKDKEKTDKARRGRYFTVGDIGYLDADGYLFLCDRKADMIISGGVNIYPAEIESVLLTHPKVGDVAVFGIPHEEWGEEVKAVIEPIEGVAGRRRAHVARSSTSSRTGSRSTRRRSRSTTSPRCRATRTASSTSASSATRTGKGGRGTSRAADRPRRKPASSRRAVSRRRTKEQVELRVQRRAGGVPRRAAALPRGEGAVAGAASHVRGARGLRR